MDRKLTGSRDCAVVYHVSRTNAQEKYLPGHGEREKLPGARSRSQNLGHQETREKLLGAEEGKLLGLRSYSQNLGPEAIQEEETNQRGGEKLQRKKPLGP